jgi:hypothetical protein
MQPVKRTEKDEPKRPEPIEIRKLDKIETTTLSFANGN